MADDFRLELLALSHADELELFERSNRAFFAAWVSDRGDEYFEHFADHLPALVEENAQGTSLLFVIVGLAGEILGRVNITHVDRADETELGYRVAEHAQGAGLATRAVGAALETAARRGVHKLKARASANNPASQRILERAGFVVAPESPVVSQTADGRKRFILYRKNLGVAGD